MSDNTHLEIIADEIGDEAGSCDADYSFQMAAARMIRDLRTALEAAEAENARLRAENNALLECRKAEKALASLTHTNDGIKGGWIMPWEREGLPKRLRAARERVKAARQGLEAARRAVAGEGEPS